MFKSLSAATVHGQHQLRSQRGAQAVLGVFHEYRQQLHRDVRRKSQTLPAWKGQPGASPRGSLSNDFSKADHIGLTASREKFKH